MNNLCESSSGHMNLNNRTFIKRPVLTNLHNFVTRVDAYHFTTHMITCTCVRGKMIDFYMSVICRGPQQVLVLLHANKCRCKVHGGGGGG